MNAVGPPYMAAEIPRPPAGAFQGSPWGELSPEATERGMVQRSMTGEIPSTSTVCALLPPLKGRQGGKDCFVLLLSFIGGLCKTAAIYRGPTAFTEPLTMKKILRCMVGKPGGASGPPIEKRFYSGLCMAPAGGSCNPRKISVISDQGGA